MNIRILSTPVLAVAGLALANSASYASLSFSEPNQPVSVAPSTDADSNVNIIPGGGAPSTVALDATSMVNNGGVGLQTTQVTYNLNGYPGTPGTTGYIVSFEASNVDGSDLVTYTIDGAAPAQSVTNGSNSVIFAGGESSSLVFTFTSIGAADATIGGLAVAAIPEPSTAMSSLAILALPLLFIRRRRNAVNAVVSSE